MFEPFGSIIDFTVLKHRDTGASRGCGFVTFVSQAAADAAVQVLHGKRTLPGAHNPLAVRTALSAGGNPAAECAYSEAPHAALSRRRP